MVLENLPGYVFVARLGAWLGPASDRRLPRVPVAAGRRERRRHSCLVRVVNVLARQPMRDSGTYLYRQQCRVQHG